MSMILLIPLVRPQPIQADEDDTADNTPPKYAGTFRQAYSDPQIPTYAPHHGLGCFIIPLFSPPPS